MFMNMFMNMFTPYEHVQLFMNMFTPYEHVQLFMNMFMNKIICQKKKINKNISYNKKNLLINLIKADLKTTKFT